MCAWRRGSGGGSNLFIAGRRSPSHAGPSLWFRELCSSTATSIGAPDAPPGFAWVTSMAESACATQGGPEGLPGSALAGAPGLACVCAACPAWGSSVCVPSGPLPDRGLHFCYSLCLPNPGIRRSQIPVFAFLFARLRGLGKLGVVATSPRDGRAQPRGTPFREKDEAPPPERGPAWR